MTSSESEQLAALAVAISSVDEWDRLTQQLTDFWDVAPASELAADDVAVTMKYAISHAVRFAVIGAVSHLGCLRDTLNLRPPPSDRAIRLYTHGQFTLVRGVLENASLAVWFLEHEDRAERVLRRLRQDHAEREQLLDAKDVATEALTGTRPAKRPRPGKGGDRADDHLRGLQTLGLAAGADPCGILKRPDYTEIVRIAGAQVDGAADALLVWKACSALAHADRRGQLAWLEVTPSSAPNDGVTLHKMTINRPLLIRGTLMAVETIQRALELFQLRANTPMATQEPQR